MRIPQSLFLLLFLSLSISEVWGQNFAGEIHFKTSVETSSTIEGWEESVLEMFGDTVIMTYFEEGGFERIHLNTQGDNAIIKETFTPNSDFTLVEKGDGTIDTLFINFNAILEGKRMSDAQEQILDLTCTCLNFEGKGPQNELVKMTYCGSSAYHLLESTGFFSYRDWYLDEYFRNLNSPYLKHVSLVGDTKLEQTAFKIVPQKD